MSPIDPLLLLMGKLHQGAVFILRYTRKEMSWEELLTLLRKLEPEIDDWNLQMFKMALEGEAQLEHLGDGVFRARKPYSPLEMLAFQSDEYDRKSPRGESEGV